MTIGALPAATQVPFWLKEIGMAVIALAIYGLGAISGRRKARRESGWRHIDAGFMLIALGAGGVFLATLLIVRIALPSWAALLQSQEVRWAALIMSTGFGVAIAACVGFFAVTGVRFNDKGIEFRLCYRRDFLRWRDIQQITLDHGGSTGLSFARITTKKARTYYTPQAMRGFRDLERTARTHGIPIVDE